MIFKRRDKRSILRIVAEFFWPKGGWSRAFHYVKHRLRRLPDPPHRIARGVLAGVMASFTPFFGFHFITAALIALVLRGNVIAAALTTFVGNPLTFPVIGVVSLRTGTWILGRGPVADDHHGIVQAFTGATSDLWRNFIAMFSNTTANWDNLSIFFHNVFLPYMVGGILPGLVTGLIAYWVTLPILKAYQNRRKGRLKAKLEALRRKKTARADGPSELP